MLASQMTTEEEEAVQSELEALEREAGLIPELDKTVRCASLARPDNPQAHAPPTDIPSSYVSSSRSTSRPRQRPSRWPSKSPSPKSQPRPLRKRNVRPC